MRKSDYSCANSTNFAMGTGAVNGGDRPTTILADPNANTDISYLAKNCNNFAFGLNAHQTTHSMSKILLCSATNDNVETNRIDISGIVQKVCNVLNNARQHADYITACTWDQFKTELEKPYDVIIMVFHSNPTEMDFKDIEVCMNDVGQQLTLAATPKLIILMGCNSSSILDHSDMPILCSNDVISVGEAETIMRTILSHLYNKKTTIGEAVSTVEKVFSKLVHKLTEEHKKKTVY